MSNFDDLLNNTPAAQENNAPQLSKEEYAAKKQAERETVFELADNTALEISGDGDRFRQFLDVQGAFSRYSAVNALLILAQKPESTRIANFDHWKSQGGYVKPGQTGISILEPGKEYTRDDGSTAVCYNVKKVFDVSQVDTRNVKTTVTPTRTERQLLSALVSKAPMKISGVENLSGNLGAYTNPETGEILVRKGMEFADTFRSVAQELCCAEIERDGNNTVDPKFTAYCSAYVLCKKYGVDTQGFSFESAPGMFRGFEAQQVKQELSSIRDAADHIAGRMAKQLDAQTKTAKSQEAR